MVIGVRVIVGVCEGRIIAAESVVDGRMEERRGCRSVFILN